MNKGSLAGIVFLVIAFIAVNVAIRLDKPRYASDQPLIAEVQGPELPPVWVNKDEIRIKPGVHAVTNRFTVITNSSREWKDRTATERELDMRRAFVTGMMMGATKQGLGREDNPDSVYSIERIEWFWNTVAKSNVNSMTNASLWLYERWMEGPK